MSSDTQSLADLHIHSHFSDGADDIATILTHIAENTDIRIAAITDHDCLIGAYEAKRLAPQYGLDIVLGTEVTTNRGHVLALFVQNPIPSGLSIPETVDCIHAQGGLALLAHPFDRICNSPMRHWPRPTPETWRSFGVDGLEAINGCQVDPRANPRSAALGKRLNLALTGGSDAHHRNVIGVARTVFPGRTVVDLRRALEQRTCYAVGHRWALSGYAQWTLKSFIPRALRKMRALTPPAIYRPTPSVSAPDPN